MADNFFEFRPYLGLLIGWPNIKRLRFYQYPRLEERISFDVNRNVDNFVLKFRYKIGVSIPINNTVIEDGTFYIPLSIEFFLDLTGQNIEQLNDRIRFEAGIGYRLNTNMYFRILYTFQEVYNRTGEGLNLDSGFEEYDHILRFSLIQKFGYEN